MHPNAPLADWMRVLIIAPRPTDASPPARQCRLVVLICRFLDGASPAAVEASSCAQGSPSKVALVRRSRWAITWIIPWGQTDHEDGPPKAATSESAVGRSSHFHTDFLETGWNPQRTTGIA